MSCPRASGDRLFTEAQAPRVAIQRLWYFIFSCSLYLKSSISFSPCMWSGLIFALNLWHACCGYSWPSRFVLPSIACSVPTAYVVIECKNEDAKSLSCTWAVQMVFFEIGNLEITASTYYYNRTIRATRSPDHVEFWNSHRAPASRSCACPVVHLCQDKSSTQTAAVQQEYRQSR